MILVTGATGHFGKATIDFLLKKGVAASEISALVRDEAKAGDLKEKGVVVKIGDYDDHNSLLEAFKGVDKVLFISGPNYVNRSKLQEGVVKAAQQAGVKHIVYTSFERKHETAETPLSFLAESHIYTEKLLRESGLHYTIFRNNIYLDALPMFIGEKFSETGIYFPAGDTKFAFAARLDMAEAAANVLTSEGHENKEYNISNTENVSMGEVAAILSEITGTTVNYISPATEVYEENLTKAGVPAEWAEIFAGSAESIKQGELTNDKPDLQNLLGRKPTSVKEFLTQVYSTK